MDTRILACLREYEAQLRARGAPASRLLAEAWKRDWARYALACDACSRRCEATAAKAALVTRVAAPMPGCPATAPTICP
jgi:hypothetical protein